MPRIFKEWSCGTSGTSGTGGTTDLTAIQAQLDANTLALSEIESVDDCDNQIFAWAQDKMAFKFTVDAAIAGVSGVGKFTVPSNSTNYQLSWYEVGNNTNKADNVQVTSANHTIDFGGAGTYQIAIDPVCVESGTNDFNHFAFVSAGDKAKWKSLQQWGSTQWSTMYGMFWGAGGDSIAASDTPDTSSVTSMDYMFYNTLATIIDVSGFDTSNVTGMVFMFRATVATVLDVSGFDTSNVTSMASMFYNTLATVLDVSGFDTSSVTSMASMFHNTLATIIDVSGFDTSSATNMAFMFYNTLATIIDVSGFDTSNVTSMASMFLNTVATIIDVSGFDTSNVTNMSAMFYNTLATIIDVSGFDTSSATNMAFMFYNTSFNGSVSHFNVSNVSVATNMLALTNIGTANLEALYVAWSQQTLKTGLAFHGGSAQITAGSAADTAKQLIANTYGWTITDGGYV